MTSLAMNGGYPFELMQSSGMRQLAFDQVSGSRDALARIRSEMFAPGVTARSITYTNPISTRWYVPGGRF